MKKPVFAAAFIIFNLYFISTQAQARLMAVQVKEFLIHNTVGGLGGTTSADIKVIPEAGKWYSYLTQKTNHSRLPMYKSYDSVVHRFIAVLSPTVVNKLLNGIAVIKPKITPATFSLSPQQLIGELKNGAKLPVASTPHFEKLITQHIINHVIAKTVVDETIMDDFEYCEMDIITRHNDTVKLSTRNLCPTKLPWTLNGRATYDMAVNYFIVAAIGTENVPNRLTLNLSYLKESIYKSIDDSTADAPIATFKWKYYYPENLKLLTENFTVTERYLTGNIYYCKLRTKTMPGNALIDAQIDMERKADITSVIEYAALIDKYFKTGNFAFNYYRNRTDSHISFAYTTGRSPYSSLRYIAKKLPQLAKTDSTQVIYCWISATDDSSTWMMFPNDRILLTYHSVTTPHGETAPIYPAQDPNASWSVKSNTYYLFDSKGKVLSQGQRF